MTPCINCKSDLFRNVIDGYDFDTGTKHFIVEECCNCKLARTSPVLNQSELSFYYSNSYYGSASTKFNSTIESWTIWSNNRIARKITTNSLTKINKKLTILDIGCGRGNLLKAFSRMNNECIGVERSDFPTNDEAANITIHKKDFLDVNLNPNSFDIIVIWHVLEHLTDPISTLAKARELLKPMGKLIIAVPNFDSLQRRLFSKHWFHLDLPRHIFHFNKKTLIDILESNKLTVNRIHTGGVDQDVFGFIQSAINTLGVCVPNTLYNSLKTNSANVKITRKLAQFFMAIPFIPVALIEYILTKTIDSCAVLIVTATKDLSE